MAELHFIADDLGFDRDKSYANEVVRAGNPPPQEDWLADADIDIASGFLRRLGAEFRMDDLDG